MLLEALPRMFAKRTTPQRMHRSPMLMPRFNWRRKWRRAWYPLAGEEITRSAVNSRRPRFIGYLANVPPF
jgi:late competence protein required for DNA uptake (superfamily II DNA/RNA helicase)